MIWEKSCKIGFLTRQFFLDTQQNTAVSPLYVKQRLLNDSNNKIHKDCRVASSMPQQSNHKRKKKLREKQSLSQRHWKGMKMKRSTKKQPATGTDQATYIAVGHKDGNPWGLAILDWPWVIRRENFGET